MRYPLIPDAETAVLRAAPFTRIVFAAIFALPLVAVSGDCIFASRADCRWMWLLVGLLVLAQLWVAVFRLSVKDGRVVYRTLFRGTVQIAIADIRKVSSEIRFQSVFGPLFRLVITSKKETGRGPLVINERVFRLKEMKEFIRILESLTNSEIPFRDSLFRR